MSQLRTAIRGHRHSALALLMLAFCIKAAIPSGFMLSPSTDRLLTVTICSSAGGAMAEMHLMAPGTHEPGSKGSDAGKDGQCAFSGLGKVATSGTDPVLLALAFAFMLVLGLAPTSGPPARRLARILPPPCGPPAQA